MSTIVKKKKKMSDSKRAKIFKKMLEDKKTIRTHLQNGGSFEELKKKGYRFATV